MKPILWTILGVSLVLAGCSQPLEGTGPGRDSNIPGLGITSFSVAGIKGEIAGTTIYVRDVPLYSAEQTLTDLRNAIPVIGYKGGTLTPAPDTPRDFSTPKIYTFLTDEGIQVEYTVVVTARPLRSVEEIDAYIPIAAGVYAGTAVEPIPVPVGMELSAKGWRKILTAVQNKGKAVALDLSACTGGTDMTGGGLYGDHTFDPGLPHSGENKVVSLVLPDVAEKIARGTMAAGTFKRYTALDSVVGAGIKDVDQYAFSDCDALTTVSFPAAVSIGFDAFSGCDGLTTVSLPTATSIGDAAFYNCDALITISFPAATSIGTDAFNGCDDLETVSLPEATSIGTYAFSGCAALDEVDLFAATSIGNNAFSGCTGLNLVYLPAAASIGSNAFSGCIGLEMVNFPMARTIGNSAFRDCIALWDLKLPEVTNISGSAFQNCTALETVNFPAARTIVGSAFADCTALVTVDFPITTSIGIETFSNCASLKMVTLPQARIIEASAFQNCTSLETVNFPAVTSITTYVFQNCTALKTVTLPAATSITTYAFNNCTALTTLNLPSATSFGGNCFSNTSDVPLTITLGASPPPSLAKSVFITVASSKDVTLRVPSGAGYGSTPSDNTTPCWANGFRGMGWNGSNVLGGGVNSNVNLTIVEYTP
jgi:hypothetical protein